MNFLYPYFLFASAFIAVPVIIHLFNFRRYKTVYFSTLRFLKEVKQETRKTSKIRHLLVLLMRILTILCLVFAFAQPYIPVKENKKIISGRNNIVSVYLDNSFSMEALSPQGKLIDVARKKAKEIASAYNSSDQFQLLTNDFEGRHQRLVSKDEFLQMVDEVKTSPAVKELSKIIRRQKNIFTNINSGNCVSYIISDFQKNNSDFDHLENDSTMKVCFIPLVANEPANIYIDSCWFASPVKSVNYAVKFFARIKNVSSEDYEKIPVRLFINGQQLSTATVSMKANEETIIQIPYTIRQIGIQQGVLKIDDDPVTFDDNFYFSYFVYDKIPVLSINGNHDSQWLNAVFASDSAISFSNTNVKNLDYSSFSHYKMIVLNELKEIPTGLAQELRNFLNNQGSLVVFPAEDMDKDSYKNFLLSVVSIYYNGLDTSKTKVNYINLNHLIYQNVFDKIPENVDLPKVSKHFTFNKHVRTGEESLLRMINGDDFLNVTSSGKGKIYLFAAPLNVAFSDFVKEYLFFPTMYQMALMSEKNFPLSYIIGHDDAVQMPVAAVTGDNVYKMKLAGSDYEFIPEHRNLQSQTFLFPHEQINKDGNYLINANGNTLSCAAFNYDRRESVLIYNPVSTIKEMINKFHLDHFDVIEVKDKPLAQQLAEINQGLRLSRLFILLALIFFAFEIILLRIDFNLFKK